MECKYCASEMRAVTPFPYDYRLERVCDTCGTKWVAEFSNLSLDRIEWIPKWRECETCGASYIYTKTCQCPVNEKLYSEE